MIHSYQDGFYGYLKAQVQTEKSLQRHFIVYHLLISFLLLDQTVVHSKWARTACCTIFFFPFPSFFSMELWRMCIEQENLGIRNLSTVYLSI